MSTEVVVALLLPFVVVVIVFGTVVLVALCRAERQDVPTVLRECAGVFHRLAARAPDRYPGTSSDRAARHEERS